MFVVTEGRIPCFISFVCCILLFDLFFCLLLYCVASLFNLNSLSYSLFFCVSSPPCDFFLKLLFSKFHPFLMVMLSIGSLPANRIIRPKVSPCCSTGPETFVLYWFHSASFYVTLLWT